MAADAAAAAAATRWFCLLLFLIASSEGKKPLEPVVKNCSGAEDDGNSTVPFYRVIINRYSCMHIAWSLSVNSSVSSVSPMYPSLYIAYTEDTGSCDCQPLSGADYMYEGEEDGDFVFPVVESDFSMGVVFKGIYEYPATKKNLAADGLNVTYACSAENDTQRSHYPFDLPQNESEYSYLPLSEVTEWTFVEKNLTFIGHIGNYTQFSIRVGLPAKTGDNKLGYFPNTKFHENSTTFDFISDNYTFVGSYSRLALDLVLVHGPSLNNGSITLKKTSDDEYTPSVFSSYTYLAEGKHNSPSSKNNHTWFFQWKPISYQDKNRKSTSSQQANVVTTGGAENCLLTEIPESLVSRVYRGNHGNITRWFVVFGTPGDNSYISPIYNTWTVAIGTGTVPSETFSFVVYITIIVGFGVPGALVVLSMVYVVLRRKPWQTVASWMNRGRGYTKLS